MGNSQYRQEELSPYQPQLTNYTLMQAFNPLSIYQHLYNGEQIMQYSQTIYHSQDIDRKLETFMNRHQNEFLVATLYLQLQGSNTCKDGSYQVKTFYQRVLTNLSKINDLPFNDSLHCYAVALKGFEILYKRYGYFQVFQNMFHICQRGKLKVWCNQHIYKSVPEQYLLGNGRQEDMVMKIISIINQNTEETERKVPIKDILIKTSCLTFRSANTKFKQIISQNNLYVSQYLLSLQNLPHYESILDIYAPHKSEVNSIKHFDTGLTFNPTKFRTNKEQAVSSHNNSAIKSSKDVSLRNNIVIPNERSRSYNNSPYINNQNSRKVDLTINSGQNKGVISKMGFFKKPDSSRKRTDSKQIVSRSNSADNYPRPHLSSTINEVNLSHLSREKNKNNINSFKKMNSNNEGSLLKKSSRPQEKSSFKILYQSSVDSQNQQKFSPVQPKICQFDRNRNPIPKQIAFSTIINNTYRPQSNGRLSKLIQKEVMSHQRPAVRAYSQNHNHQPQPLTASRARTFVASPSSPIQNNYSQLRPYNVNIQAAPIYQQNQQISFTNNHIQFQHKNNPQVYPVIQGHQIHQNHVVNQGLIYPIYPIQKVIPGQNQINTLKKTIKFKPAFQVNGIQNARQSINNNVKQITFTNNSSSNVTQVSQKQLNYSKVRNQFQTYNTPQNTHLHSNQKRQNNHLISSQFSQQQASMEMSPNVIKRYQTLPNKLSFQVNTLQRSKMDESPLLLKYTPSKVQRNQNSYQKQVTSDKLFTLGNISNRKNQVQRQAKKDDKFQLPQLESKILLLQSFAQNKINTHQFLSNQSHALSNVKWEKSSNSGRDSITSAFRKELLLQNNYKPFDKRTIIDDKKNEGSSQRQANFLTKFDYDHLQTDPRLLEMIKSVSKDYKKQLSKTSMLENKYSKITSQYDKKDVVKEIYNPDKYCVNNSNESRFKRIAMKQKQEKYVKQPFSESFGKLNFENSGRIEQTNHFLDSIAFKKKAEPYLSNKFSAISEKEEEENVCSTSNGSMGGKNYLQNLDTDILQDMAAYGMECTKGKPRQK